LRNPWLFRYEILFNMRSLPLFGIGIGFALLGLALFALTLRGDKWSPSQKKSSGLREQQSRRDEAIRLRMTAAGVALTGVVLMLIS
jgi:hypothetical protein